MSARKPAPPTTLTTRIVGYASRRTGETLCLEHGQHHIRSSRSEWAAVRLADSSDARDASRAPVICQVCGTWLNDESTGYALVSSDDDHWSRRLCRPRGHR
jgi:hypothetical protein